jgi:hypothetical protein
MTDKHICWICNKPVNLQTTMTDERGRVVHEECYVAVCGFNEATKTDVFFYSVRRSKPKTRSN